MVAVFEEYMEHNTVLCSRQTSVSYKKVHICKCVANLVSWQHLELRKENGKHAFKVIPSRHTCSQSHLLLQSLPIVFIDLIAQTLWIAMSTWNMRREQQSFKVWMKLSVPVSCFSFLFQPGPSYTSSASLWGCHCQQCPFTLAELFCILHMVMNILIYILGPSQKLRMVMTIFLQAIRCGD